MNVTLRNMEEGTKKDTERGITMHTKRMITNMAMVMIKRRLFYAPWLNE